MLKAEELQTVVDLVGNVCVNPNVDIDYFIPGVSVTTQDTNPLQEPYVEFTYSTEDLTPHKQQVHLKDTYLEKSPQDLANLLTFYLEQFMGELDSRQYGAQ